MGGVEHYISMIEVNATARYCQQLGVKIEFQYRYGTTSELAELLPSVVRTSGVRAMHQVQLSCYGFGNLAS